MKIIIAMIFLFISGCTLHQKNIMSQKEITQRVDNLMTEVYKFALSSESYVHEHGRQLTENELKYAKSIGIKYPEKIRVLLTKNFPVPQNKEVLNGFKELGYDSILVAGVTYGHSIFIKPSWLPNWLYNKDAILAHELVHVRQVEETKNYKNFLRTYLIQAFTHEYFKIPYEQEAYESMKKFKGFDNENE